MLKFDYKGRELNRRYSNILIYEDDIVVGLSSINSLSEWDWENISIISNLSEELIDKYWNKLSPYFIMIHQYFSSDRLRKYLGGMSDHFRSLVIYHQKFTEDELIEYYMSDVRDIWSVKYTKGGVINYNPVSEHFIRRYRDQLHWYFLVMNQNISDEFIESHLKYIQSETDITRSLVRHRQLSEKFLDKYINELDGKMISIHQNISEDFFDAHKSKLDPIQYSKTHILSDRFIKKYNICIDGDNWGYISSDIKKSKIIELGVFECFDDYFIGYMLTRLDDYLIENTWSMEGGFKTKYDSNKIYSTITELTEYRWGLGFRVSGKSIIKFEYTNTGGLTWNAKIRTVRVKYSNVMQLISQDRILCSTIEIIV